MEDIVKIPDLLEHYQEHQVKYGDGFISFLNKHYGSEKEDHKSEDSDHEDLPFHHTHHTCIDLKVDAPIAFYLKGLHSTQSKHYFVYKDPITSRTTHSIHQPPKSNC